MPADSKGPALQPDELTDEEYRLGLEAAWTAAEAVYAAILRCAAVAERMGHPDVATAIRETVLP